MLKSIWMMVIVGVMIGGAAGCLTRLLIVRFASRIAWIPAGLGVYLGTSIANVLGCLLIGMLVGWLRSFESHAPTPISEPLRIAAQTGVLGGLTTFSSFIMEAVGLFDEGRTAVLIAYLTANLLGGLLAFLLGCGMMNWYAQG
ncbi:MAG: CrcB family protein [Planctomycetota bacterium]